jgi:hypothetical protein
VGLDRKQSGFSFLLENLRPAITNNIHKAAICIKAPVFIIFEQHPTSLIMKKLYAIILFIYSMSAGRSPLHLQWWHHREDFFPTHRACYLLPLANLLL